MGKKKGKEKEKNMKNQDTDRAKKKGFEHFLAATADELILAINELPDGIILEVYFEY